MHSLPLSGYNSLWHYKFQQLSDLLSSFKLFFLEIFPFSSFLWVFFLSFFLLFFTCHFIRLAGVLFQSSSKLSIGCSSMPVIPHTLPFMPVLVREHPCPPVVATNQQEAACWSVTSRQPMMEGHANECTGPIQEERGGDIWEWINSKKSVENTIWAGS